MVVGGKIEERLRALEVCLPSLRETGWLLRKDGAGIYHDQGCAVAVGTTMLAEHRLGDILAGERCCHCTGGVLEETGSVGGMLLRLTDPVYRFAREPESTSHALAVLLRGSNRAVPQQHFNALRRQHLLPVLDRLPKTRGDLCVLTAGDLRHGSQAPEQALGAGFEDIRRGFLAQSARGAALVYLASEEALPEGRGHPRVLESGWEPGTGAEIIEAFFTFAEDALSGATPWGDLHAWWTTAKLL
jgi:hypothetical protein